MWNKKQSDLWLVVPFEYTDGITLNGSGWKELSDVLKEKRQFIS